MAIILSCRSPSRKLLINSILGPQLFGLHKILLPSKLVGHVQAKKAGRGIYNYYAGPSCIGFGSQLIPTKMEAKLLAMSGESDQANGRLCTASLLDYSVTWRGEIERRINSFSGHFHVVK